MGDSSSSKKECKETIEFSTEDTRHETICIARFYYRESIHLIDCAAFAFYSFHCMQVRVLYREAGTIVALHRMICFWVCQICVKKTSPFAPIPG